MWLTSYDSEPPLPPVEIELVSRLRIGARDDHAWGHLAVAIRLSGGVWDHVIVGARHKGDSVWEEPERWPMHVYICTTTAEGEPNELPRDQVTIAKWGLLHQTRERAEIDKY